MLRALVGEERLATPESRLAWTVEAFVLQLHAAHVAARSVFRLAIQSRPVHNKGRNDLLPFSREVCHQRHPRVRGGAGMAERCKLLPMEHLELDHIRNYLGRPWEASFAPWSAPARQ